MAFIKQIIDESWKESKTYAKRSVT